MDYGDFKCNQRLWTNIVDLHPYLQNVYLGEEGEEPVFQYVPEKRLSPGLVGDEATPLHQSLLLLVAHTIASTYCTHTQP